MATPELEGQAHEAALHRGGNVQIIASAGSGKTEVVAQRIVSLLEEGVDPEAIVAFTFTEKAAASLAARVQHRAKEGLGEAALGKLGPLYIGTIHAYCFELLQRFVARYETYDVLDDNQLAAFLAREARRLRIKQLDAKGRLFEGISTFLTNAEVVENELIDVERLTDPFRDIYRSDPERLDAFRVLSFGQLISHAIAELEKPAVHRGRLRPAAPTDRRRVPGRQPRPGAADQAAGRRGRRRAVRGRRRRPSDLPVARVRREQHHRIRRALPEHRAVHDRSQSAQQASDHQDRRIAARS